MKIIVLSPWGVIDNNSGPKEFATPSPAPISTLVTETGPLASGTEAAAALLRTNRGAFGRGAKRGGVPGTDGTGERLWRWQAAWRSTHTAAFTPLGWVRLRL